MIIGIYGKARSGKDTFAEFLIEEFKKTGKYCMRTAFAAELKQMCMEQFGLSRDELYGDLKESMTVFGKNENGRLGLSSNPADYWTPREIMQAIGSFYRSIDYDFWVHKLGVYVQTHVPKDAHVIITDVRHINECEYVKNNNGVLIKIVRGELPKVHGMDHESETALDGKSDSYFDVVIHNNVSLDKLREVASGVSRYITSLEKLKREGINYGN